MDKANSTGDVCDEDGYYTVTLKSQECDVRFQYVGYEPIVKTISFKNTSTIVLDIEMNEAAIKKEGVVIAANRYER